MMEFVFILSVFFIFHAYVGYPISLWVLRFLYRKDVQKKQIFPYVTIIITVYNEEKRIEKKILNTLELFYPRDKIQIIIASDGSTDNTIKIAELYVSKGLQIVAIDKRKGKENAQKEAMKKAFGEIIVFTDVATMLIPSSIENIVANFADPEVGCVSSEDRLVGVDGKPSGEGYYIKYEMWLRRLETSVNSLVGLSGSFFAARKELCEDFSENMQSDFRTLLNSIKRGFRGVCDSNTVGYYSDIADHKREFNRKVRTILRGLTVFFKHIELLNPFRYGMFSYQLFCHKLIRWLVPGFLFILLFSNIYLYNKSLLFQITLILQLTFYSLAVFGIKAMNSSMIKYLKIPTYFLIVNASIIVAWWQYIRGQRVVMWTPSER